MSNNMSTEEYRKTYTTFGGCDITAAFNGRVIGEIQGITYSVTREKAAVYTMGSAEPRSFSRGKRGIAGSLVFTVFNRDALIAELTDEDDEMTWIRKFKGNDRKWLKDSKGTKEFISINDWDTFMTEFANDGNIPGVSAGGQVGKASELSTLTTPKYADEILPFDITVTFANEYRHMAKITIYGVEILNEATGYSIDSVSSERAYTFVARSVDAMEPLYAGDENLDFFSTTWY